MTFIGETVIISREMRPNSSWNIVKPISLIITIYISKRHWNYGVTFESKERKVKLDYDAIGLASPEKFCNSRARLRLTKSP